MKRVNKVQTYTVYICLYETSFRLYKYKQVNVSVGQMWRKRRLSTWKISWCCSDIARYMYVYTYIYIYICRISSVFIVHSVCTKIISYCCAFQTCDVISIYLADLSLPLLCMAYLLICICICVYKRVSQQEYVRNYHCFFDFIYLFLLSTFCCLVVKLKTIS